MPTGEHGTVYWITGLSGAGKSTTARILYERLRERKPNVVLLDGDELRDLYGEGLGYTSSDRRTLALRNARMCRMLSQQGLDVICATISLFHECHAWCRSNIERYCEIYLDVPLVELRRRDRQGLYRDEKTLSNVMGVDLQAEVPLNPDLVIWNDGDLSAADVAQRVWDYVRQVPNTEFLPVEWDYTRLADAYLKRPEYAADAIDEFLLRTGTTAGEPVCDIGAGTGNLTVPLARRGLDIVAVEPNSRMSAHGVIRTQEFPNVRWHAGVAEETGQPQAAFRLVTFGSSFNVTDRPRALQEAARVLRPEGWLVCLFNHRDLSDPYQAEVQRMIERLVPDFRHGTRRDDQTPVIDSSGLFGAVQSFSRTVVHTVSRDDYLDAWSSHCTLRRQAGERCSAVLQAIADYLTREQLETLEVPYHTRVWLAPRR